MWPPARWWAFWSTFILPCKAPRWAERARLTVCIRRATALCICRPSITIKEGGGAFGGSEVPGASKGQSR
ncbi:hypothetical protein NQZ68_012472 [Dissostichus eleginoides]|nr:hypothetical protein NQZ68_012472 [Dissostichus eleginoides]